MMDETGIPIIEAFSIHERWILLGTGERLTIHTMLDAFQEEVQDESEVVFLMADYHDTVVLIHIPRDEIITVH